MEGEDEWVDVVGQALQEAIKWVEGVAGKWCWDLEYVMLLM